MKDISTINLKNGPCSVNCFLISVEAGFILIDTGFTKSRAILEDRLKSAGCKPGNLRLIIVTHGDFDHIGNCRYLRDAFKAPIAMHENDLGMAQRGDMFWNRKKQNAVMKTIAKMIFKLSPSDQFSPDIILKEGDNFLTYGLDATVLEIPGHTSGSIGIRTSKGNLFCGDMFSNLRKPVLNSTMDDLQTAKASLEKLAAFQIFTVYPGHGTPFDMDDLQRK